MDPFGVLNLIRSLLETNKTAEATPPPSDEKNNFTAPSTHDENPPSQTENSYLLFAKAHDERAKKLRK